MRRQIMPRTRHCSDKLQIEARIAKLDRMLNRFRQIDALLGETGPVGLRSGLLELSARSSRSADKMQH